MVKVVVSFCEFLYDMMLLNFYWCRFTLLGGILFSLIPATITVYDCIRKRILQKNEAPVKELFSAQYQKNKQENRRFYLIIELLVGAFFVIHYLVKSLYATNLFFEFTMRMNIFILLLLAISFFPVHAFFSLNKKHRWLQPLLLIFICPVQTLMSVLVIFFVGWLYSFYPLFGICLGIGLPAYGIAFIFFLKFQKMNGVYF
jgi:uncharacterized membrane protein YesL